MDSSGFQSESQRFRQESRTIPQEPEGRLKGSDALLDGQYGELGRLPKEFFGNPMEPEVPAIGQV